MRSCVWSSEVARVPYTGEVWEMDHSICLEKLNFVMSGVPKTQISNLFASHRVNIDIPEL